MKTLYTLALLGVSLLTLTATAQRPNDWQRYEESGHPMPLKGKVSVITARTYNMYNESPTSEIEKERKTVRFNESGMIVRDKAGAYHYNGQNLRTQKVVDGTPIERYEYTVGDRGQILTQTTLKNNVESSVAKYSYDAQGRLASIKTYSDGVLFAEEGYTCNPAGRLIRKTIKGYMGPTCIMEISSTYTYNSQGLSSQIVSKMNSFNGGGTMAEEWKYLEFDKQGNWTKAVVSKGGLGYNAQTSHTQANKESTMIIREIAYYD